MDRQQLNAVIDENVSSNGVRANTGSKVNKTLKDIADYIDDKNDGFLTLVDGKVPNENLTFGEVKEGDLNVVSGGDVFDFYRYKNVYNYFDVKNLNQTRKNSNRSVIYKKSNINFKYINIYAPKNGNIKVFKAVKEGVNFKVIESFNLETKEDVFSYPLTFNLLEDEYVGVNFVDYGYVIQLGENGSFLTLNSNVDNGVSYNFKDVDEFVKVSFSENITTEQDVLFNSKEIGNSLEKGLVINTYDNDQNDKRLEKGLTYIYTDALNEAKTFNYVKINKPLKSPIIALHLRRNVDNSFSLVNSSRAEVSSITDTYKINLRVDKGNYIGIYAPSFGLIASTIHNGSSYIYKGDPTAGNFAPVLTDNVVKVSFISDFNLKDKVDNISNIVPFDNSVLNIQDTSQKLFKTGEPIYLEDPYGYNQFLHPNVRYFKNGWNRYKYWMCVTPMPMDGELYPDRYENPCIYVSNDAINWSVMQGSTNPIDELTEQNISRKDYMSDPCLVYRDDLNRLECWYRISYAQENFKTLILRKYTTDGVNWSDREVMVDTSEYHMIRSQAMRWDNLAKKYRMWYTGGESGSVVSYNESLDGKVWDNYKKCSGISKCWHLDIEIVNGKYYLLNYETDSNLDINQLRLHVSDNGIDFDSGVVILKPELCTWYASGLYKSTIIYTGKEWVMYFSGETNRRYIGIATGSDPFKLNVLNGGYIVGTKKIEGNIEIITTNVRNGSLSFGNLFNLVFNNNIGQLILNKIKGILKI